MEFRRQTNRRLHEEHVAVIDLLARVEKALVRAQDASVLADGDFQGLLRTLLRALEFEVGAHFDFEERELFPRMAEVGEADLVALFEEEHVVIRDVASEVRALATKALGEGLAPAQWQSLRTHGLELCERLTSHAEKEEGALLPLLEDLLDEENDREAFAAYAAG
ncbi:MAG: hemerythrin domain-containing protein [Burkholderiales bacterium]|nr:hemerythrin domain-containing protein [Burkholderiales bacterium]